MTDTTPQQPDYDVDRVIEWARPLEGREGSRSYYRQWIDTLEESVRVAARQINAGWAAARSADTRARVAERQATEAEIRAADQRQRTLEAEDDARQQRADSLALAAETDRAIAAVRAGCEGQITVLLRQLDDLAQRHHHACHLLAERPTMTTTELQTMVDDIIASTSKVRDAAQAVIADNQTTRAACAQANTELVRATVDLADRTEQVRVMGTVGDAMLDRIKDAATDRRERSSAAVVGRRWRAAKEGVEYVGATGGSSTAARAGSQVAAAKDAATAAADRPSMCFRTDQPCTVDTCDQASWVCDGVGGCLPDDTPTPSAVPTYRWPSADGTGLTCGETVEWQGEHGMTYGRVIGLGQQGMVTVRLPTTGLAAGSDPYAGPGLELSVLASACTIIEARS